MNIEDLPKQYSPAETETKWQKIWEESGIFTAQSTSDRPSYTVMIPPPNVTGSLHMGHAFEEAIIDTLVRYQRMMGKNTLWLPGTDHASIAVQTILEKQLKAEGKTKQQLGRQQFLERAWAWKAESGGTIVNQLRRLGLSVDWSRERFTLDAGLSEAVIEAFVRLYEDGLIYRGEYLVNWCPASQSAVSDLEVDLQATNGHLWHFRYPIKDSSEYLIVATTRPETMLGDTAVAVNPEDDRYQHLIGKTILLPILNREIPIVGDIYVDPSFGTGCVKVTPAHDFNDFEIGQRHNLPSINILNKDGSINQNGAEFEGCDRFVARRRVVAKLEELGFLEKIEDYTHNVPYSERGKVPVEPFLSTQWFVKIRPMADFALTKYDRENSPRFIPDRWGKVYRDWLVKLKDWCISRQLWWGHQIPAWYDADGNFYVARTESEAIAQAKAKTGNQAIVLVQDADVLDTWFSSGLWSFSTLGWPKQTDDLATFYPTSTLVTGFDIIFFWVARMTMMSGYFTGKMPFQDVYIHGLIRDENNQKMSKSKNNGIDPLVLIAKYGTDALRYSLVKEVIGAGQDVRIDYNRKTDESSTVEAARNFANKLWNASRFVLINLAESSAEIENGGEKLGLNILNSKLLELSDRWILSRFYGIAAEINQLLQNYSLGEGAKLLYEFIWGDFCDYYIELVKPRLLSENASSKLIAQQVLFQVLDGILRLLHPYMPHITEEIWQTLPRSSEEAIFLALQPYPQADSTQINPELETQFALIFEVIRVIRNLRADSDVKPSIKVKAFLQSENESDRQSLIETLAYIENLAKAEQIEVLETVPPDLGQVASGVAGTVQILIPLAGAIDLVQLQTKLTKSLQKIELAIAPIQTRLANPGYVLKAPPEVIAKAKAELEELQTQTEILKSRLLQISAQIEKG
jgi:valyl-tRNA synthetase